MVVKFKRLNDKAIPFRYIRFDDVCMDIYANEDVTLKIGETRIIKTGIALEIPRGYEGVIRGRSGLSSQGILVHTGTVENSYRGEIGVICTNLSGDPYSIHEGDRIAQFTVKIVNTVMLKEVDELSKTERGDKGFGSSGK